MKRKILIIIGLLLLAPKITLALTGDLELSCSKNKVSPGESVTCYLKGNTTDEVTGIEAKIVPSDNLTIVSTTNDSKWQSFASENNIINYASNSEAKGTFNVATIVLKAGNVVNKDETLQITNINLIDASFNNNTKSNKTVNIRIANTDATLSSLKLSNGEINFSKDKFEYEVTIDAEETVISAYTTLNDATISGDVGTKSLKVGLNTFVVTVTSESGSVNKYTIKITRPNKDSSVEPSNSDSSSNSNDSSSSSNTTTTTNTTNKESSEKEIENPKTGFSISYVLIGIVPAGIAIYYIFKKKQKIFNI